MEHPGGIRCVPSPQRMEQNPVYTSRVAPVRSWLWGQEGPIGSRLRVRGFSADLAGFLQVIQPAHHDQDLLHR